MLLNMSIGQLVSYVITLLGLIIIFTVVAVRNYKSKVNISFMLFSGSVFVYILASFLSGISNSLNTALWIARLALFLACLTPASFYIFTIAFTGEQSKRKWLNYAILLSLPILSVIAFWPQTLIQVSRRYYGATLEEFGPLLYLTLIYYIIVFIISFYILIAYAKNSNRNTKLQVNFIMFGVGLDAAITVITQMLLPVFNINSLGNLVGTPAHLLLVGGVGYAILKHHMFDIKAVILRYIGFIVIITIATTIFAVLILGTGKLIFPNLQLSFWQAIYYVSAAVLLAMIYQPMLRWIERKTSRVLYRDKYNSRDLLNSLSTILASQIDLARLCSGCAELITKTIHAKSIDIIILDKQEIYYTTTAQDLLPSYHELIIISKDSHIDDVQDNEAKSLLRKYDISVLVVLKSQTEIIGYLLIGPKLSGNAYDNSDILTFNTIADELAIAAQNSRSYKQVLEFNKTLQEKVDIATEQLTTANNKLKNADAIKDDFISMASHQLTTPLASIEGYLSLANGGYLGDTNKKLKNALVSAAERTNVMKGLINDLLNVSRMTGGKFFLEINPVDIVNLINTEVKSALPLAKQEGIKLNIHIPKTAIDMVKCDEQKVRQVIANFISNALSYSPKGQVDVFISSKDDGVEVRIEDNGIGVPEDQKSELFNKFFRATNAITTRPSGTGIGLYLAKRVIGDHGGKIIFNSTQDKGSVFGFYLPFTPPATANTTPRTSA